LLSKDEAIPIIMLKDRPTGAGKKFGGNILYIGKFTMRQLQIKGGYKSREDII